MINLKLILILIILINLNLISSNNNNKFNFKISENEYTISMKRLNNNNDLPLLDSFKLQPNNPSDEAPWNYNYNVAYCPFVPPEILKQYDLEKYEIIGLAVRVQNLTNDPVNIYSVGPSSIVYSYAVCIKNDHNQCEFNSKIMFDPSSLITGPSSSSFQYVGAEDPRIVMIDSTIYMYYTAVNMNGTNARAQLALATCDTGSVLTIQDLNQCWVLHGPIIENSIFWSKSAGLLYREDSETQYLFYGDTDIFIATTDDLINYTTLINSTTQERITLFTTRDANEYFDSQLVESGPEPLQLSDGNWLYLYNSGQQVSTPNQKPNWNVEYNLGFIILNGTNDEFSSDSILYRSPTPLFSPLLDWEMCDNSSPFWSTHGLTPLVVFIEGWLPIGNDQFLVLYQGCDSVIGTALITVTITKSN